MGVANTIQLYWLLDVTQPEVLDALRDGGLLRQMPCVEPEADILVDGRPLHDGPSRLEEYRRMMQHGAWRRVRGRLRQVRQ